MAVGLQDLTFRVIADTKGAIEGLSSVGKKAEELNRHTVGAGNGVDKLFHKIKIGAAIAAAAFTAIGVGLFKMGLSAANAAAENEKSQRQLALTISNVTGATKEATDAVNKWVTQVSLAYGVTTNNLTPALGQLVRQTRDVAKAQEIMGLAMDVAAGTPGADLLSVSTALGEAYKGNYSMLTRLKTGLSEATLKSGDFKKITAELAKLFAGQAAQSANTFEGQVNRMQTAFQDVKENIGTALIPVFEVFLRIINEAVIPALRNLLQYLKTHPEAVQAVIKATATTINVFKDMAKIALWTADAFFQYLSIIARLVQGLGYLWRNKEMKDWGRNTAENLMGVADALDAIGDKLDKFDANKFTKKFDFSKVELPGLFKGVDGGISGGAVPTSSASATVVQAVPGSQEWMKQQAGNVTYIYNINTTANTNATPKAIADNTVFAIKYGTTQELIVPKAVTKK